MNMFGLISKIVREASSVVTTKPSFPVGPRVPARSKIEDMGVNFDLTLELVRSPVVDRWHRI